MNDYLEAYQAELKVLTPVHVGDGTKLNKKEYIFQRNTGKVSVMDIPQMYQGLARKGLQRKFTEYFLEQRSSDLGKWMRDNNVGPADYNKWVRYSMEGGGCLADRGRRAEIIPFQKDAYGCPFIPGSTIKGMLRSILLSYELNADQNLCRSLRQDLPRTARNGGGSRKKFLSREQGQIEEEVFHILNRQDERGKEQRKSDAVNDCLSGLIVGDSEPLSVNDLVLCQKIDQNVNGEINKINILRESLKPGTVIRFRITIDAALCKYTIEEIQDAIRTFGEMYFEMFSGRFPDTDRPSPDTVWIGGGTGFATKTVLYPLLGYEAGVMTAMEVFENTLSYKAKNEHKHNRDNRLGVSPHMLKCTEYQGRRVQMGMCRLRFVAAET